MGGCTATHLVIVKLYTAYTGARTDKNNAHFSVMGSRLLVNNNCYYYGCYWNNLQACQAKDKFMNYCW